MILNRLRFSAAIGLLALGLACSGQPAPPSGPPPGALRVDDSKTGQIAGRVVFEGTPPENRPLPLSADPFCQREHPNGANHETYVVDRGGLRNVFVYVKDGLGNYYFDVPTEPVKLDQKGCIYNPHVIGVRAGQPIEIMNSDNTLHNVHALPESNREFNFGQSIAGQKDRKTFTAPEALIPIKCDAHNWMIAYAGVVAHPYFAVSGDEGKFELRNVPPGTYTIEAVHEKLGRQTQSVTLGEKGTQEITFTFKAGADTH